ncbi:nesprin-2 [Nematolebias whitei]|uniref:nesprin-2 n=1 Tax=Nematolebias whitei TaxID=451745 RepID=UPI00189B8797|nr:nesprin-2 [Nematolebias whitei]
MAGVTPPSSERRGGAMFSSDRSNVDAGEDVMDLELLLDLVQNPFLSHSSPLEVKGEERQRLDENRNQDGALWTRGQLDRRWALWHEFMKEHAHLDAWLRLAEQAVTSLDSAHISYSTAKEELKKVERLRCEAGSQLIQLDSLTRRNRTLTRLFQGTMQTRLLASAQGCDQRWDGVNAKLDAIAGRLQVLNPSPKHQL